MSKNKIIVLHWLRGHRAMTGKEKALAKKATLITETRDHSQKDIKVDECPNAHRLKIRISQRLWTDTIT